MKLLLLSLSLLACGVAGVRRHRSASLYPSDGFYYPQDTGYTVVEKIYPPARQAFPKPYYKSSLPSLNWAGAPLGLEEGGPVLSGSLCGPCGGLSGSIGCGSIGGSICTPLGSLSGSIGESSRPLHLSPGHHHGPIHGPLLPPSPIHSYPSDPCGTRYY